MKKFRILVIALLCLTISGVYAAWTFAEDIQVDRDAETVTVTLAEKAGATEALGTFSINTEGFSMVIDQKANGVHETELKITGNIVLQFKPNANVSQDVKDNGIEATYYFAVADSLKYTDGGAPEVPIFNIDTYTIHDPGVGTKYEIHTVDSTEPGFKWQWNPSTSCFEYTLTENTLKDLIQMNTFTIDTSAEYAAFNEVLRSGTITLYLNDTATMES